MTLDEFKLEMQTRLNQFEKYWKENNQKTPELFPLELNPGDWDEHFQNSIEEK